MTQQRTPFYLSKKWWTMLLGLLAPFVAKYLGVQLDVPAVLAILMPVLAYLLAEASVDRARAERGPTIPRDGKDAETPPASGPNSLRPGA